VYLKSLTITGFKSFPERTTLDLGPGVSVIVGPNGSGKSNVTDAVLWVMGEQSPTAVRGHSMQDVIFGGGRGVQPRSAAEVEVVLDNADGAIDLPLSEISIVRRLERSGEGSYRLNGTRCRLADIRELLADTGLGRESHSVISQGRVGEIVLSRPRERRVLIEEAAGLGKHRARRRRAQLKLERTAENLDRALDIEREARSRLKPLGRQARAAELHERLELQSLQARLELARDEHRTRTEDLARARQRADGARAERDTAEAALAAVAERRGAAERALAERAERLAQLSGRVVGVRGAIDRIALRREQAAAVAEHLRARAAELARELESAPAAPDAPAQGDGRVAAIEAEMREIDAAHGAAVERELEGLREAAERLRGTVGELESAVSESRAARTVAEEAAARARQRLAAAEAATARARSAAASVRAEHAAASQFVAARSRASAPHDRHSLAERLTVQAGLEAALAVALGPRLDAFIAADVRDAGAVLDEIGDEGGSALVAAAGRERRAGDAPSGAQPLAELVDGPADDVRIARTLLQGVWLVERIDDLPESFAGIAVTRGGRRWDASSGELRQLASGGSEQLLARRAERDRLAARVDSADAEERAALQEEDAARNELAATATARDDAAERERATAGEHAEAAAQLERAERALQLRRAAPAEGPAALRRAQLEGELAAEQRRAQEETVELERGRERHAWATRRRAADEALAPRASALLAALDELAAAARSTLAAAEQQADVDREAGAGVAAELADCGAREAELQSTLRACAEQLTDAEVQAQRARDALGETESEMAAVQGKMGLEQDAGSDAAPSLTDEQRGQLRARIERLQRRREQLGPVNPLAQREYADAVAHVEELEERRADLDDAMRELRAVIREADRQIERRFAETFAAAAENFERMAGELFPGGSGRLTLVEDAQPTPRRVLGGGAGDDAAAEEPGDGEQDIDVRGVEIEIVPAGKSARRLSLLSGGEKSMTALAFLFAVFLARPCPFYILDEVEAALDDLNLDRFIDLVRRHADRAQFIVITHQRRTMEAADALYGVSMASDGVSKVLSRRLPRDGQTRLAAAPAA